MKGLFLLVLCVLICNTINELQAQKIEGEITEEDYAYELSAKVDTIEVIYIAWACACVNWLLTEYAGGKYEIDVAPEKYCVFIEASRPELVLPDKYHIGVNGNRIRLIGSYYKDKGISRDYIQPTSQIPEKARVFRYTQIEIIKPYTIIESVGKTRVIQKGEPTEFD